MCDVHHASKDVPTARLIPFRFNTDCLIWVSDGGIPAKPAPDWASHLLKKYFFSICYRMFLPQNRRGNASLTNPHHIAARTVSDAPAVQHMRGFGDVGDADRRISGALCSARSAPTQVAPVKDGLHTPGEAEDAPARALGQSGERQRQIDGEFRLAVDDPAPQVRRRDRPFLCRHRRALPHRSALPRNRDPDQAGLRGCGGDGS